MKTYSAYWYVKNNPKPSARRFNHVEELAKKNVDVFFGEKEHIELDCKQIVLDEVPGEKYVKPFHSRVLTKHRYNMPPGMYTRLCGIIFSKVLLLERMRDLYPREQYFTWVDCVKAFNKAKILELESDKIVMTRYQGKRLARLYKQARQDKTNEEFLSIGTFMHACVIRCPAALINTFIDEFFTTVEELKDDPIVYDEEVIFSFMYRKNPDLFELVDGYSNS